MLITFVPSLSLPLPCNPGAEFKEMDVVMVLPSEAAVDALKEEVFEVENGEISIPEDGPLPPGSPPRASFMSQSKARPLLVARRTLGAEEGFDLLVPSSKCRHLLNIGGAFPDSTRHLLLHTLAPLLRPEQTRFFSSRELQLPYLLSARAIISDAVHRALCSTDAHALSRCL